MSRKDVSIERMFGASAKVDLHTSVDMRLLALAVECLLDQHVEFEFTTADALRAIVLRFVELTKEHGEPGWERSGMTNTEAYARLAEVFRGSRGMFQKKVARSKRLEGLSDTKTSIVRALCAESTQQSTAEGKYKEMLGLTPNEKTEEDVAIESIFSFEEDV